MIAFFLAALFAGKAFAMDNLQMVSGDPHFCTKYFKAFKEQADVQILEAPSEIALSPEKHPFPLKALLKKSFKFEHNFEMQGAGFQLEFEKPQPKTIYLWIHTSTFFSGEKSEEIIEYGDRNDLIPATLNGRANLKFYFGSNYIEYDREKMQIFQGYCRFVADLNRQIRFTSTVPDMLPPLVRGISFDKKSYAPGDTVWVTFTFTEALGKMEARKVTFSQEKNATPAVPLNGSNTYRLYEPLDGFRYKMWFDIPRDAQPGRYYLTELDRSDKEIGWFSNHEESVGKNDPEEKRISQKNPLIVSW